MFLVSIKQKLTVVLICISLMVNDAELFFSCGYWPFVDYFSKYSTEVFFFRGRESRQSFSV